jgi:hypothetical protein
MSEPRETHNGDGECLDTMTLSDLDRLAIEDMRRHAAMNRSPMAKGACRSAETSTHNVARLEQQNAELHARVEELEAASKPKATPETEFDMEPWTAKDYEDLLHEKTEIIRSLQMQLQTHDLQDGVGTLRRPATGDTKDKEALVLVVRQMHRAMTKDQAEISRLHGEIARLRQQLSQDDKSDPRD